jgi:hypothetical protein
LPRLFSGAQSRGRSERSGQNHFPRQIKHTNGQKKRFASNSPKSPPKKRRGLKLKPGQPSARSKLSDEIQQQICNVVSSGQSLETAAMMCRINRTTIRNWRLRGQEDPKGRYGQFMEAIDHANEVAIGMMVNKLLTHPDPKWTWKILKNKRPEEFNERLHIRSEVSGVDGGAPIPVDMGARFTVNVNCPPSPDEPEEEIVDETGEPILDGGEPV